MARRTGRSEMPKDPAATVRAMRVCRDAMIEVCRCVRPTGPALPCSFDDHLGDRREGDVPDRGKVLFFRRRLCGERRRQAAGRGRESPRERREALAHVTYFVALPFDRNEEGELVAGEAQDRAVGWSGGGERSAPHGRDVGRRGGFLAPATRRPASSRMPSCCARCRALMNCSAPGDRSSSEALRRGRDGRRRGALLHGLVRRPRRLLPRDFMHLLARLHPRIHSDRPRSNLQLPCRDRLTAPSDRFRAAVSDTSRGCPRARWHEPLLKTP